MKFSIMMILALLSIPLFGVDLHDELALEYFNLSYSDSLIYNALDKIVRPEVYAYVDSIVENWFRDTKYWESKKSEIRSAYIAHYRIKRFKDFSLPIIKESYSVNELKDINAILENSVDNIHTDSLLRVKTDILESTIEAFKSYIKKGSNLFLSELYPKNPNNPDELCSATMYEPDYPRYDKPPILIEELKIEYPEAARKAKLQGTVILQVEFCREGSIGDIFVLRSFPGLDEAAKESARKIKFQPAVLEDEPVGCMLIIPIEFALKRR